MEQEMTKTALRPVTAAPNESVGIDVSQVYQGSSILPSDVIKIVESSTLYSAVTPVSLRNRDKILLALPALAHQPWTNIFSQNVARPTLSTTFSLPGTHLHYAAHLEYCDDFLHRCLSPSSVATTAPDEPLDAGQQVLIEPCIQSDNNTALIQSLIQMTVKGFGTGNVKTTAAHSEVLLFALSRDKEYYRKVLISMVSELETARLLDPSSLQGLIRLVESASSGYLEPNDIVRILAVLLAHLQDSQQQTTMHTYYLVWALSCLSEIIAEGKAKDLRYVFYQEPLYTLLNQLKDSDDPYLKHQATYASQILLHAPYDETHRQYMLQHTGNVTMSLLRVPSVCELNERQLEDGADYLYWAARDAHETDTKIASGVRSFFEGGQDILLSGRQFWYTSLREAQQLIRNGRLKDFNHFVTETPFHDHIDFQRGICQLLGDIAVDPLWETSTRQQAVDFLAELHWNNSLWKPSEGIYRWILNILRMVVALEDTAVSDHALLILRCLEKAGNDAKQKIYRDVLASPPCSYPLRFQLPISVSSTLLSQALAEEPIAYDILRLRDLRLQEQENPLYIEPQAKPNLQASDATLFPLMERAFEFLAGPCLVFLLLGESGGGKSTFNLRLERTLWKSYKRGDPIPLHINLPSIENPQHDMIGKQLKYHNFTDTQIIALKQKRQFIVLCDGYDEIQPMSNIHTSNHFNQPGQWNVKMIVTCRTQYLGSDYRNRFAPQGSSAYNHSTLNLFQEAVIAPFTEERIQRYVDLYISLEPRIWDTKDYMDRLNTIPNLMDLVKNPFLLSLALEALPGVSKGKKDLRMIKVTRVQIYDTFVQNWLEVNQRRLENNDILSSEDRRKLVHLLDAGFVSLGVEYLTNLAQAIFDKHEGNPVVQYVHIQEKNTWKSEFFGSQAEIRLLRESSPLTRAGNQYHFVHRSMLEYFYACSIYNSIQDAKVFDPRDKTVSIGLQPSNANGPFFQRDLLREPSVIQFLCDRVKLNPDFKHQLRAVIDLSKTDANAAIAATNAITILVRAGVTFNGADLRGIKVSGADFSHGQFDSAQFQGADLKNVNLSKSWLRQADMSNTHMEGVRFEERLWEVDCRWSSLDLQNSSSVKTLAYSCNSRSMTSLDNNGVFRQWDAATGISAPIPYEMPKKEMIVSRAYAPDGSQLAFRYRNGAIRLWNCHTDTAGPILLGCRDEFPSLLNENPIERLVYSPCCRYIIFVTMENTVELWDLDKVEQHRFNLDEEVDLGEKFFGGQLKTVEILAVAFSSSGSQLAIGCKIDKLPDRIFFITLLYDTQSKKKLRERRSIAAMSISSLVFSPNDQQIAIVCTDSIQLWNLSSKRYSTGLIEYKRINCIAYSPCGKRIASASKDRTVGIWSRQFFGGVERWSKVHTICAFFGSVLSVAWDPIASMELVTSASDGSTQLWRMSVDNSGEVVFKLVWGSNLSALCTEGTIFTNAIGFSALSLPCESLLLFEDGADESGDSSEGDSDECYDSSQCGGGGGDVCYDSFGGGDDKCDIDFGLDDEMYFAFDDEICEFEPQDE